MKDLKDTIQLALIVIIIASAMEHKWIDMATLIVAFLLFSAICIVFIPSQSQDKGIQK